MPVISVTGVYPQPIKSPTIGTTSEISIVADHLEELGYNKEARLLRNHDLYVPLVEYIYLMADKQPNSSPSAAIGKIIAAIQQTKKLIQDSNSTCEDDSTCGDDEN